MDPKTGKPVGATDPPSKPKPQNYRKSYLPFENNAYPVPLFTNDTWHFPPIHHQGYLVPEDYYDWLNSVTKLSTPHANETRERCETCHADRTTAGYGYYHQWLASRHANARKEIFESYIRQSKLLQWGKLENFFKLAGIPEWFVDKVPGIVKVAKRYPQAVVKELEVNLDSLVGRKSPLWDDKAKVYRVSCIDCHVKPGATKSGEKEPGIVLPTTRTCGTCHARQWVELISELTVNTPPFPPGRSSHAAGWISNIAVPWYATNLRQLQIGCDSCHNTEVRGCDSCHTRHSFEARTARHPKACETCHIGPDHPDYESWSSSKHGHVCEVSHPDYDKRLAEAVPGKDYKALTCQYCHMRYKEAGEVYVSHNMVVKAIWRMGTAYHDPTGKLTPKDQPLDMRIALNKAKEMKLAETGCDERRKMWTAVCTDCHGERFVETWRNAADEGLVQAFRYILKQKEQVQKLFDAGLLMNQKFGVRGKDTVQDYFPNIHFTLDYPAGLWRWFHKGEYTGSEIERRFVEVWFRWLLHFYKGTFHMSPDISFHQGIVQVWKEDAYIDDEELKLRKLHELERRLKALEAKNVKSARK
ncbi:MAG: multiheme c-type cytochrome [Candidatus Fervidibacter sp.]|uniref:multiheme c-type cytochrome n=1 Tax=Candidatus Fervidibacter sp. TaxID=3100871 RepID=UPI00404AF827